VKRTTETISETTSETTVSFFQKLPFSTSETTLTPPTHGEKTVPLSPLWCADLHARAKRIEKAEEFSHRENFAQEKILTGEGDASPPLPSWWGLTFDLP